VDRDHARTPGGGIEQDQPIDALGMPRGEQLGHQAAFRSSHQRWSVQPGGVHDGEDVGGALLEGGCVVELVRQPDPPLVERGDADVAGDVLEEPPVELMLPNDLNIRDDRRYSQYVGT
jgi:hypothetical protein